MKHLIICGIVLSSYMSFAQSGLIDYTIPFEKDIVDCAVFAYKTEDPNEAIGRIESIIDSKINLKLSPNRDYRVLVNNTDVIEISGKDVAFTAKELQFRQNLIEQEGLIFTVQIGAFKNKFPKAIIESHEDLLVDATSDEGLRRYMLGTHDSPDDVLDAVEKLKQAGYPDAFPIAYQDGERINFSEVKNKLDQASK